MTFDIRPLSPKDIALFREMLDLFGEVFDEAKTYSSAQPSDGYLRKLLGGEQFVGLAAVADAAVIGGLAAYELKKFEQARSEFYIYDLAVTAAHRRRGVATALIGRLKKDRRRAWRVRHLRAGRSPRRSRNFPLHQARRSGRRPALRHQG